MFLAFTQLQEVAIELASISVLLLALVAAGRRLKRKHGVRLGLLYLLFSVCFSIYVPLSVMVSIGRMGAPPPPPTPAPEVTPPTTTISPELQSIDQRIARIESNLGSNVSRDGSKSPREKRMPLQEALRALGALVTLLGALVVISLVRRFFWELWFEKQNQASAPKFLSQLVALAIFLTAVLLVLTVGYEHNISVLLGASGVAAIVLGLALQDLLGNIIAGIALELNKPFKVGDWLKIDNKQVEVVEVNWRSTRLRDNDDIYFDIPNKQIVGGTIVNLTSPNRQHGIRMQIGFDYHIPPNLVRDTLQRATINTTGVITPPAPKVFLKEFGDSKIMYEIRFWMDDQSKYNDIMDGIRTNVWYECQRAGLTMPFPIRTVQLERKKKENGDKMEIARAAVRRQPFLQLLSPQQVDILLSDARVLRFGRNERIIEQGAEGKSMFILVHGEAEVLVKVQGVDKSVANLRDSDYFGEMSLLTGERRSATVIARTDCEMLEIGKNALARILAENQSLVENFSEMLAERKMETEGIVAEAMVSKEMQARQQEYKEGFLQRLYGFFEL